MFVTIVLNIEYMDVSSRSKFYLKNLLHSKENGWIMITHEYMRNHILDLQKEIAPSLFSSWEMNPFTMEEVQDVEQYYIPDKIFTDLESKYGSRTEFLMNASKESIEPFETCISGILDEICKKHPGEKIEGVFHALEGFYSLRKVCKERNIPLIPYVFSAIRKPHGYMQTLYSANTECVLYSSEECKKRYNKFLSEKPDIYVLSNKEILTLLGKERNLCLLPLMDKEAPNDMLLCGEGFLMIPHIFSSFHYTDDDIDYEISGLYPPERIKSRQHPMRLDSFRVDRTGIRNDPASIILSCKRATAVCSQIMLKIMLWNRTAIMKKNSLPFSFMLPKQFDSLEKADLLFLNFYIFTYLIPSDLMFSGEYWKWRMTNPSETEIYWKHIDFLFKVLGVDNEKVKSLNENERFKYLLEARGCDSQLIDELLNEKSDYNINWDAVSSQFDVVSNDGLKSYWRIDEMKKDGSLVSKLIVDSKNVKDVLFYPLYDVAGYTKLDDVRVNGSSVELNSTMTSFQYMPKNKGCYVLPISNVKGELLEVECCWEYKKNGCNI